MNSRQRIVAALRHEPVDRIPYGEFAVDYDTVAAVLGRETFLRNKAGSTIAFWESRRDEVAQSWREDFIEFYRRMDCFDILNVAAMAGGLLPPKDYDPDPPRKIAPGTWQDRQGRVYKYSPTTNDITCVDDPVAREAVFTAAQFDNAPPRTRPDDSVYEVVDALIAAFRGERFLCGPSGGETGWTLVGGMERGLMMFIDQPDVVRAAIARATRDANAADAWAIRDGQDGAIWGADFAYKAGPMVSPAMWHEFCFPAYRERTERLHARGQFVLKHACGNNLPLLDDFVAAGFDCYQSLQATAGVHLDQLKASHGDRLCLWGGMPLEVLQSGTTDEVRAAVRQAVRVGAPGSGFIFGTSHSVAVGTPYDNFMAMIDEFLKVRDQV
ncbi:MAG TPA: uroporphyrinogen decarboxylase family protein [Phycisphaerae bacterium]|nr:uroporphyrinogen decarboxylase family protein [Phycisphaerae bacterium]